MPINTAIRAIISRLEAQRAKLEKQRSELKEIISALRGIVTGHPGRVRDLSLNDHEKRLIEEALGRTGGNQTEAARILKITRDQVRYKMAKHGVKRKKAAGR